MGLIYNFNNFVKFIVISTLHSENLLKFDMKHLNCMDCISNTCNLKTCVNQEDIGFKLCDGDMRVSKHVAVQTAQRDCCYVYCYGIDCWFVG